MAFNLSAELETLGLSPNEAKVYIASLKVGPSTAQLLAAKATISRPTTYIMIESLVKKGLMSSYMKGKKKFFAAANPNQLAYIVNNQKREIAEKEAAVGKIVEALGKMVTEEKSALSVRVLEGAYSIQEVQQDMLDSGATEACELVNLEDVRKHIPPMFKNDIREKLVRRMKVKSLRARADRPVVETSVEKSGESRDIDAKKFPIRGELTVYADRILLGSHEGATPKYVIIRDGGLAQTAQTMFNALWKHADEEIA